jgi:hypothetical protein
MNMIGNLTGFFGNLLTGYLFNAGRPELVFIIFACAYWLGTLCWQGVDVTKPLSDLTGTDHSPDPPTRSNP